MVQLWKISSTTIRNPDRIQKFSQCAKQFKDKKWTNGEQVQIDFQISLIQNKLYLESLTMDDEIVTQEEAVRIAGGREGTRWTDPAMRGRTSMSPLRELGIFYLDKENKLCITDTGLNLIDSQITIENYLQYTSLKFQQKGVNIIPVIGTIQLIDKVNRLWEADGNNPTGLSLEEFNLFVPSLIDHEKINSHAENVIEYRKKMRDATTFTDRKQIHSDFQKTFAIPNLQEIWDDDNASDEDLKRKRKFQKLFSEYGDVIKRFLRNSGWIHMRGGGFRVDLNPMRKIENDIIIQMSCIPVIHHNEEDRAKYLSDPESLVFAWRTKEKLIEKYELITNTISERSVQNNVEIKIDIQTVEKLKQLEIDELDSLISNAQLELQRIVTINQIQEVSLTENIIEIIANLTDLPKYKAPVELEYETTRALRALNDGQIKPNYPLGDDGLPTNTAKGGVGDIECFYVKFNLLCEVTLLKDSKQWMNEGQPVNRHYLDFTKQRNFSETFCLFIAPQLHPDTIAMFHYQNRRPDKDQRSQIIPITITQFLEILKLLLTLKQKDPKIIISHEKLLKLYQEITLSSIQTESPVDWLNSIQPSLASWRDKIITNP
jgi:hypothetical protein